MTTALVCIDFIEEIIGKTGMLSAKGYGGFAHANNTLAHLAARQESARASGNAVIHVRLGFESTYADHPKGSLLLGAARDAGILRADTPSTEFVEPTAPVAGDITMDKKRLSAFYGTPLEATLRALDVTSIVIAGVATDLAVQSAARDAHDRDFEVFVAADSCAAASEEDHLHALSNISKFASVL